MSSKMVSFSIQGHGQDGPPPEVVFRRASRIVEDKTLSIMSPNKRHFILTIGCSDLALVTIKQ